MRKKPMLCTTLSAFALSVVLTAPALSANAGTYPDYSQEQLDQMRDSVAQGVDIPPYTIGVAYMEGKHVNKSEINAAKAFQLASDLGHEKAHTQLTELMVNDVILDAVGAQKSTPKALLDSYDKNAIRTELTLKDKPVLMEGRAFKIAFNERGQPYVMLEGVYAGFSRFQTDDLIDLNAGDSVRILCLGDGIKDNVIAFRECVIGDEVTNTIMHRLHQVSRD